MSSSIAWGCAVIDEQHKFGVKQRVTLRDGGVDPHYPRHVCHTHPTQRRDDPVRRRGPEHVAGKAGWPRCGSHVSGWRQLAGSMVVVRQRTSGGRSAGVCGRSTRRTGSRNPRTKNFRELIDPAEPPAEDITSVHSTYEQLRTGPLKGLRVGLLHGPNGIG
ncbi:hypothetical protein [Rhodopirellula europaea]|uniref:hypothetical protein n=1 Tax=Rhodopirellula europaea TaxID=1263866 RepID=UPI003D272DE6